jgi:aldehyde dehydrogenase (NAD+)
MSIETLRETFAAGVTTELDWRISQLDALAQLLEEAGPALVGALNEDLGKPPAEAMSTDLLPTMLELQLARDQLATWAADRPADVDAPWLPATAYIRPEPLGVVLIIGPWNFPVQLVIAPLIAAIAAGNAVIIKPSELAPATSAVLAKELTTRLDPRAVEVHEGGVDIAQQLLAERFDHILYTGSTGVGRIVAQAAAVHLTPTTLELGGKCPTYVDASANLDAAAERIAWTKLMNAGQICLAPDYVLVHRDVEAPLIERLTAVIERLYGAEPLESNDLVQIVNDRHVQRLIALRDGEGAGTLVYGGKDDPARRRVGPALLHNPTPDSAVMQEEIFGPLLPIITVDDLDDAISYTATRPKPLAAYVFAEDPSVADAWVRRVPAGGATVNATLLHNLPSELPFGGVGDSGMGRYHGRAGFDTFSNLKSVLIKPSDDDLSQFMPPYATT